MAEIICISNRRETNLRKCRISKAPSLYENGLKIATIDFFGRRVGEKGTLTLHGEVKRLGRVLRGLADKVDPPEAA